MTVFISSTARRSGKRLVGAGLTAGVAAVLAILPSVAVANNYGESLA